MSNQRLASSSPLHLLIPETAGEVFEVSKKAFLRNVCHTRPGDPSMNHKRDSDTIIPGGRLGMAVLSIGLIIAVASGVVACGGDETSSIESVQSAEQPRSTSLPVAWSSDALEFAEIYRRLLEFKGDPDFHALCFAQSSPYKSWEQELNALGDRSGTKLLTETGIVPGDLWQMAWDYCNNEGGETDHTRFVRGEMKPGWARLAGQ